MLLLCKESREVLEENPEVGAAEQGHEAKTKTTEDNQQTQTGSGGKVRG